MLIRWVGRKRVELFVDDVEDRVGEGGTKRMSGAVVVKVVKGPDNRDERVSTTEKRMER